MITHLRPPQIDVDPTTTDMSSSPFIKRVKARTNLRQRDESAPGSPLARTADDAGDDEEEMGVSPMQMAKNRKKDKEKRKSGSIGKSRLSFGVEDEEVSVLDRLVMGSKAHWNAHDELDKRGTSFRGPEIQAVPIHLVTEAGNIQVTTSLDIF